ncbi:MAG: O-antigen ligase family protein [Lachnospiraceae bacterium]|nr:O-antigen ligase family protein [Lachnospiraceae bacterium]
MSTEKQSSKDLLGWCKTKLIEEAVWRRPVLVACIYFAICSGIAFMNAGDNYGQAVAFRKFCIAFGGMVLAGLPVQFWLTIWSGIWLPVCYLGTHVAYEKHWIPDLCNYEFVDIIRLGKLVIMIWGLVFIAILRDLIRHPERMKALLPEKKDGKRRLQMRKILWLVYLVFAVLMTICNPGYFYAGFFVIGIGPFYYMLSMAKAEKCTEVFLKAFLDGMLLSLLYVSYQCLWHRPYDTERYLTYFSNSNMAGGYLACVSAAMAGRVAGARKEKDPKKRSLALIVNYIAFVWTGVLIIYNYTRTTILGLLFAYFVLFVLRLLTERNKGRVVLRYGLAVVLLILAAYPGYLLLRYVPAHVNDPVALYAEYNPQRRIVKDDPVDSWKYTSITEFLRLALGKWGIMVDFGHGEGGIDGQDQTVEIDEGRDVTNGRTEIWAAYIMRISLKGHYPGHIETEDGSIIYHAHNSYLQMCYQYGIPVGLAYAVLVVGSFVCAVWMYWKRRSMRKTLVFPLLMSAVYMVAMMTEWLCHPAYVICFSFFYSSGLLLYLNGKSDKTESVK